MTAVEGTVTELLTCAITDCVNGVEYTVKDGVGQTQLKKVSLKQEEFGKQVTNFRHRHTRLSPLLPTVVSQSSESNMFQNNLLASQILSGTLKLRCVC